MPSKHTGGSAGMDLSMQNSGLDGNWFVISICWPLCLRERDVVTIAQESELFWAIKWVVLQGISGQTDQAMA